MDANNPNRRMVKELVSVSPGIHLRRLQKLLGLSFTTTRYHVNNLVRDGEVTLAAVGGYTRLFPAGTPDEMKVAYASLQNKNARAVLEAILESPRREVTQAEVARSLGVARSTVTERVSHLSDAHLVKRSLTGDGRVVFGVVDGEQASALLKALGRRTVVPMSTRRVELRDA